MISNNNQMMLSEAYLKGYLKLDIDDLNLRIKELSKNENVDTGFSFFIVFKRLIDSNFAFQIKEELFLELLFKSAEWASKEDSKQKVRPKNFSDVKEKRNVIYFTSIIQSLISYFIRKHNLSSDDLQNSSVSAIKFEYEFNKYLNILHELTCIKRRST